MEMYYYIKKNKGIIATTIDTYCILKQFMFNEKTTSLKKAVESSIEKCIATDLVDELLKSDVSVLFEMYYRLHQIGQPHIAECFRKEYPDSDETFYEYTHAKKKCHEPIPCNAKLYKNNDTIVKVMMQYDINDISAIVCQLWDIDDAISQWNYVRISRLILCNKKEETAKLLLTCITNKYQYDQFKLHCATYCKAVLPYL